MLKIVRLNRRFLTQWGVVAAGLAGLATAFGLTSYGMYCRNRSLDQQLTSADRLFRNATAIHDALDRLQMRRAAVKQELDCKVARIPSATGNFEVLRPISAACEANGLTIKNFRPQSIDKHSSFSEQVVSVQAAGDYRSICRTLDALGRLPWYSRISKLTLASQGDGGGDMQVDLQLAIATSLVLPL